MYEQGKDDLVATSAWYEIHGRAMVACPDNGPGCMLLGVDFGVLEDLASVLDLQMSMYCKININMIQ